MMQKQSATTAQRKERVSRISHQIETFLRQKAGAWRRRYQALG
jgi:hypothetical protein